MTKEELVLEWKAEEKRHDDLFKEWKILFPTVYGYMDRINFHVPKGWVGLVKSLSKILEYAEVSGMQVKQKLGELRFYTTYDSGYTTFILDVIKSFERVSRVICENCGTWGAEPNETGFIQTLCNKCREDYDSKWAKHERNYKCGLV